MRIEVKTWYLEMLEPSQLRPASLKPHIDPSTLTVTRAEIPCPAFSRFLYTAVGEAWYWIDRLKWTEEQWMRYLDRPELQTWVAYCSGTPAGYIELQKQSDDSVQIAYFGLLKPFIGQGIGGHLLTVGVQQAWQMNPSRVWVHTCSLDSEYALANYQARGFKVYKDTIHYQNLPN